jgi:F-type H+-transporting ATPase subunit b
MRTRTTLALAALLAALLAPAPAGAAAPPPDAHAEAVEAPHGAAAEAHGAPEGGLFAGDVGNAIWTVVIFVLALAVLGKFAWTPILKGLQGREQFIRDALAAAKTQRDEAEARLAEYEAKLAAARDEVDAIMDEARRDAEAVRLREEERAREEAEKTIARARREIEIAADTAVKDLYARAARLATAAAGAVLRREIRPEDHERLVAESIAALDRLEGGALPPVPPPGGVS